VFDLSFIRRSETDGGNDRLAVEEIWAAGIRDQRAGNSGVFSFCLGAEQGIEAICLEADLGAGKVFKVFS